jgi:Region found in RelA / SpoT proteins
VGAVNRGHPARPLKEPRGALSPSTSASDISGYPHLPYSRRAIQRAGEVIASNLPWNEETEPLIRDAFKIANNWRDSHAFPMRSIRHSAIYYMRDIGLTGITAARLKRMQAIRRKLRRFNYGLQQLQDLGGCRVILPTISDVERLVRTIKEKIRHEIKTEDNYLLEPKIDGYRSHHIIFHFSPKDSERAAYTGRRIELQVRTQLQHSWATAIEAVGLFRGEELKNNQGSPEWLRLFKLMSAEFAEAERCPVAPGTPSKMQRQEEVRHLAHSLGAVATLEKMIHGVRGTDIPLSPYSHRDYYLIRYDHATNTVYVEPLSKVAATMHYHSAEEVMNRTDHDNEDIVLVEVDKIENLKKAYPNYFGDVTIFGQQLRALTQGESAAEYSVPPKQRPVPQRPGERINPSWLKGSRFQKPSFRKRRK